VAGAEAADEFSRVAASVPPIPVEDPAFNASQMLELVRGGDAQKIALMILPEPGFRKCD
jgi:hypothetical protein